MGGFGMVQNCCRQGGTLMSSVWLRTLAARSSRGPDGKVVPNDTPVDNLWDFTTWAPDLLVINLGTNDVFGGWTPEVEQAYGSTYLELVGAAIGAYGPRTKFLLACGPMTSEYCGKVRWVVDEIRESFPDVEIEFLDMTMYLNGHYGPSSCGHPSEEVDIAMADGAMPVIRRLMHWGPKEVTLVE